MGRRRRSYNKDKDYYRGSKLIKHHRRCKSNGGKGKRRNGSYVSPNDHKAWHTLFENMTPHQIAEVINTLWIERRYKFICVERSKEVALVKFKDATSGSPYQHQHRHAAGNS